VKDPDHLIKVEKAIEKKFGIETIQNPKMNWNPQKEQEYLKQIKQLYKSEKPNEKIEVNGVLMPKKLFTKESERTCVSCKIYTQSLRDDVYMIKFNCCHHCYIKYVDGREEKWLKKMENNNNV